MLQGQGQREKAIEMFLKAVALDDCYHDAFNNLGVAFFEKGQTLKAVGCFKKAVNLKDDFIEAYFNLGKALAELGLYSQAIEYMAKAALIDPSKADTFV
jgi:tetratricopeptide (TPR) repeat protein